MTGEGEGGGGDMDTDYRIWWIMVDGKNHSVFVESDIFTLARRLRYG